MRKVPPKGTIDDLFKRLCNYIQPIDSKWYQKIKPATSKQIEDLRIISGIQEIGLDFPPSYYTFLKYMGQNDGGLLESEWDGFSEVSIDSIIEHYSDNKIESEYNDPINPYNLVFLDHWAEAYLYFDLKQGTNPPIYTTNKLHSQSFENYLFQRAFLLMQEKYYSYNKLKERVGTLSLPSLGTSTLQMAILLRQQAFNKKEVSKDFWETPWLTDIAGNSIRFLESLLKQLGFQKLWFSDIVNYCGVLEDISIMVHGTDGFWISIRGENRKMLNKIHREIEEHLWVDEKYFDIYRDIINKK